MSDGDLARQLERLTDLLLIEYVEKRFTRCMSSGCRKLATYKVPLGPSFDWPTCEEHRGPSSFPSDGCSFAVQVAYADALARLGLA